MAFVLTIELPDRMPVGEVWGAFEPGDCCGCPFQEFDMDRLQTICPIMALALPPEHDTDAHPWKLCPIKHIRYLEKEIQYEKDGYKWQRPDSGAKWNGGEEWIEWEYD